MIIEINSVVFRAEDIIAFGKSEIAPAVHTKAYPTITIWLHDVVEPLTIPYVDEVTRDTDYSYLKEQI